MPTGTPHHGHIPPYTKIRVDSFTTPWSAPNYQPANLFLLTHTHADHVGGLEATSFGLPVVCSADAKSMLLLLERQQSRVAKDRGEKDTIVRPYAHLCGEIKTSPTGERPPIRRDLLRVIPLNTPTEYEVDGLQTVTVTAIDANHCPGSVMFLVEGAQGAVLHTGDVRSEPSMISALETNPFLQPYLAPSIPHIHYSGAKDAKVTPAKTLEAIFLDTACLTVPSGLPSKRNAVRGLLELLMLYPPTTRFFINSWTWGYEDILMGIARTFATKIHVDRYKYRVLTSLSNPFFKEILTMDHAASRFHACERFNRCESSQSAPEDLPSYETSTGNRIVRLSREPPYLVYVNPVEMSVSEWAKTFAQRKSQLLKQTYPTSLIVPLARHSTLPELRALVALFKPKRVVPNTLYPNLKGRDWACLPRLFGDVMDPGAKDRIWAEMRGCGVGLELERDVWLHGHLPRGNHTFALDKQIPPSDQLATTLDTLFDCSGLDVSASQVAANIINQFRDYGSTDPQDQGATGGQAISCDDLGLTHQNSLNPLTSPHPRHAPSTTTRPVGFPEFLPREERRKQRSLRAGSENSPRKRKRPGDSTTYEAGLGSPSYIQGPAVTWLSPGERTVEEVTPLPCPVTPPCARNDKRAQNLLLTPENSQPKAIQDVPSPRPHVQGMRKPESSHQSTSTPGGSLLRSPLAIPDAHLSSRPSGAPRRNRLAYEELIFSSTHQDRLNFTERSVTVSTTRLPPQVPSPRAKTSSTIVKTGISHSFDPSIASRGTSFRRPEAPDSNPKPHPFSTLSHGSPSIQSDARSRLATPDLRRFHPTLESEGRATKRRCLPWRVQTSNQESDILPIAPALSKKASGVALATLRASLIPAKALPSSSPCPISRVVSPELPLRTSHPSPRRMANNISRLFQSTSNPELVASPEQVRRHEEAKAREAAKKKRLRKKALDEMGREVTNMTSKMGPTTAQSSLPIEDEGSYSRNETQGMIRNDLKRRMSRGEVPVLAIECLGDVYR